MKGWIHGWGSQTCCCARGDGDGGTLPVVWVAPVAPRALDAECVWPLLVLCPHQTFAPSDSRCCVVMLRPANAIGKCRRVMSGKRSIADARDMNYVDNSPLVNFFRTSSMLLQNSTSRTIYALYIAPIIS